MTTFADQLFFGQETKKGIGKGKGLEALGNLETAARDARLTERGPLIRNTHLRSLITSTPLRGKERGILRRKARQEVGLETWAGMVALGVQITLDTSDPSSSGPEVSDINITLPPPSTLAAWDLEPYRVTSEPCAPCRERGWRCEWTSRKQQQVLGNGGGCRGCVLTGRGEGCDRPWRRKEEVDVDGQLPAARASETTEAGPEMDEQDDDEPEERNQETEMEIDSGQDEIRRIVASGSKRTQTPFAHVEAETEVEMNSDGGRPIVNSSDDEEHQDVHATPHSERAPTPDSDPIQTDAEHEERNREAGMEADSRQQEGEGDADSGVQPVAGCSKRKRGPDSDHVQAFKSLYISYIPSSSSPQSRNSHMIEVGEVRFPALGKGRLSDLVELVRQMPPEDVRAITAWLRARQDPDISPSSSPPPSTDTLSPPRRGRKRRKTESESPTPSPEAEIHSPALIAAHALHAYHVLVIALTSKEGMKGKRLNWNSTHPVEKWDLLAVSVTPCDECKALGITCQAMRADHPGGRCRRCDVFGSRCQREGEDAEAEDDDDAYEEDIMEQFRAAYDNPPLHGDTKLEELESPAMDDWLDNLRELLKDLGPDAQSTFEIPLELWTRIVLLTPPSKLPPGLSVGEWILDFDIHATELSTPCTGCTTTPCERINATLKGTASGFCRKCFFESNRICMQANHYKRLKRWPMAQNVAVEEPGSPTKKRKLRQSVAAVEEDAPRTKKSRKSFLTAAEEGDDSDMGERSPVSPKKSNPSLTYRERFLAIFNKPPPTADSDLANLESPRMDEWLAELRAVLDEVGHAAQVTLYRDTGIPLPVLARIVLLTPPEKLPVPVGEWVLDFSLRPTLAKHSCRACVERGVECQRVTSETFTAFCRECFMRGDRMCQRSGKPCMRLAGWPSGDVDKEKGVDEESLDELTDEEEMEPEPEPTRKSEVSLVDQFLAIYEDPPCSDEEDPANVEGDEMDEWVDRMREVLRAMPAAQQKLLDVPLPMWTRIVLERTPESLPLAVGEWIHEFEIHAREKRKKCQACGEGERCESIWRERVKFCRKCFFEGRDKCGTGAGRACVLPESLGGLVRIQEEVQSQEKTKTKKPRKSIVVEHVEEEDPVEMDEPSELDYEDLKEQSQKKTKTKAKKPRKSIVVEHAEEVPVADASAVMDEPSELDDLQEQFLAVYDNPPVVVDEDLASFESPEMDEWLAQLRDVISDLDLAALQAIQREVDVPLPLWTRIILLQAPHQLSVDVGEWILDFDASATPCAIPCQTCVARGEDTVCERVSVGPIQYMGKESQYCRTCFFEGLELCVKAKPPNKAIRLKRWPMPAVDDHLAVAPKKKLDQLAVAPKKKLVKRHSGAAATSAVEKFVDLYASADALDLAEEESPEMDAWLTDIRILLAGMAHATQQECRRQANVPLDVWARIVLCRRPSELPVAAGPWILDFDMHATLKERACLECEKHGEPCERITTRKVAVGGDEMKLSVFCRRCFFAGKRKCGSGRSNPAVLLDKWVGLVKAPDEEDVEKEQEQGGDVDEEEFQGGGDGDEEQEEEQGGHQEMQSRDALPPPVMGEFSVDTDHGVLSGRSMSMAPPSSLPPSTNMPPPRAMSMAPPVRTMDKTPQALMIMGPPPTTSTSSPEARLIDRLERDLEKKMQEVDLKEEELRAAREGLKAKEVAVRALEMELEEIAQKKREDAERWQREEKEREAEVTALRAENERIVRERDEAMKSERELRAAVDVVRRTVNAVPCP